MKYLALVLALSGCATFGSQSDKTTEQVIAEVNKTADKLEKALDVAQDRVVPALDLIDDACQVVTPECSVLHEKVEKFELALDKAADAVEAYRKFTGTFADAAKSINEVIKLGSEVIQSAAK